MSKIVSIGTAVPAYRHDQKDILHFMQNVFAMDELEKRKLKFLYHQSAIQSRYSALPDYSLPAADWQFYPATENLEPFPNLEKRMDWYNRIAPALSVSALEKCLRQKIKKEEITHLITVSCTGMSAPGLDLQIMEWMDLPKSLFRTSVNFMGCYAAIHALKLADSFCRSSPDAKVAIVCTELCTLHFQKENTVDNITSSLLFGDGSAAILVTHDCASHKGVRISSFYSEVGFGGKEHMSWRLSSTGFLMQLSGYVPELIEQDFGKLLLNAIDHAGIRQEQISHWCIHPGGKRILGAIEKSASISTRDLRFAYGVLNEFGNMSSPTILFVLKQILESVGDRKATVFGAAFGPGLTMETFILSDD